MPGWGSTASDDEAVYLLAFYIQQTWLTYNLLCRTIWMLMLVTSAINPGGHGLTPPNQITSYYRGML